MNGLRIVMTPQELVEKLATDLSEILQLRDATHYSGKPDERDDDEDVPEGAWETWASEVYNRNNTMGLYLADAEKVVDALRRYVDEVEGEEEREASNHDA